jgi:glutaminase
MGPVSNALADLLQRNAGRRDGQVADYIPELATADPDDFGIAVVSVLGRTYAAGDSAKTFTIQSISKPFVYALALSELGLDEVARHVGFEPSGEPFNAISLEPTTGRPANPLINAGAIVTSALIAGNADTRFARIRDTLSAFAGRDLELDERVYRSEAATGNRNRALAYLTLAGGALSRSVEDATDVYFRQCSLLVSAVDLAVMAATLANAGINPVTGVGVISEDVARSTMAVMATCGMYDNSGEWMVRVGLPAKSGVGGGIVAVQPAEFGIGIYSPPLDARGNSTRGVATLEDMSAEFQLHLLAHPKKPRSPILSSESDGRVHTVTLLGELDFIAAEQVVHHVRELAADTETAGRTVRVDLTNVTTIRPVAQRLLAASATELAADGTTFEIIDPAGVANRVT